CLPTVPVHLMSLGRVTGTWLGSGAGPIGSLTVAWVSCARAPAHRPAATAAHQNILVKRMSVLPLVCHMIGAKGVGGNEVTARSLRQRKCKNLIPRADRDEWMTVHGIGNWRGGDRPAGAEMPERLAGRRIDADELAFRAGSEHQPAARRHQPGGIGLPRVGE